MKRRVDRFPVREAQMREGGALDPRDLFKFDPGQFLLDGIGTVCAGVAG